jgi:hypothetical protein
VVPQQEVAATVAAFCFFLTKGANRMNVKFTDINATADYIGPGAIEVPMYQTEITDLVRRRGVFGQRI